VCAHRCPERISYEHKGKMKIRLFDDELHGPPHIILFTDTVCITSLALPCPPKVKTEGGKPLSGQSSLHGPDHIVIHISPVEGMRMAEEGPSAAFRSPAKETFQLQTVRRGKRYS